MNKAKLYFVVGSQDLYGEECLKQVAEDAGRMAAFLDEKIGDVAHVELLPTVETSELCIEDMRKVESDDDCIGVITWMHTFSPAKMWIKGLQILRKPLLHLHTQANEFLPYDTIDMDFMNLNQAAHGDREYGFILHHQSCCKQCLGLERGLGHEAGRHILGNEERLLYWSQVQAIVNAETQ